MSACECAGCGEVFTGLTPFDRHQDVDYERRPAVKCLDPASLGMVQNRFGQWGRALKDGESSRPGRTESAGRGVRVVLGTPGTSAAAGTRTGP